VGERTFLKCLHDAPQSITNYVAGIAKVALAHVLVLVKSYIPTMNMRLLVDGAPAGCTEE
jgi:hypothetical protein